LVSWEITGAVNISVQVAAGANAVISAVFVDPSGAGPPPPAATPELGSGALLVTGLGPIGLALYLRRRARRRARTPLP